MRLRPVAARLALTASDLQQHAMALTRKPLLPPAYDNHS